MKCFMFAALALLSAATPAAAQNKVLFGNSEDETAPRATITFDSVGLTSVLQSAVGTGWVSNVGFHLAGNVNYATGTFNAGSSGSQLNSFFNFNVPALSTASPYTSATLTIKSGDSVGTGPFTLSLFDVSADFATLNMSRNAGDPTGQALFTDLGSGTLYGQTTVTGPYTTGQSISIALNSAFLSQINSGLLQNISIGGTLTPSQVVTSAVPEPASWALMIGGFGIVGGTMRRRRGVTQATAAA